MAYFHDDDEAEEEEEEEEMTPQTPLYTSPRSPLRRYSLPPQHARDGDGDGNAEANADAEVLRLPLRYGGRSVGLQYGDELSEPGDRRERIGRRGRDEAPPRYGDHIFDRRVDEYDDDE